METVIIGGARVRFERLPGRDRIDNHLEMGLGEDDHDNLFL